MYKLTPISREKIGETHSWRDFFNDLFRMLGSGAVNTVNPAVIDNTALVTATTNTALTDAAYTCIVTVTGLTITLPAASAARIGKVWTVNFSTTGNCTIQRAGSDTIMTSLSATDTSVVIYTRGTTMNFQCASATTWIIV